MGGLSAPTADWIERYELAWRTAGTRELEQLFTRDATYRAGPFDEPMRGLAAIADFWERERAGPDEQFELSWQAVAVEGPIAVARVEVRYLSPQQCYRDLWIIELAPDGRCVSFEEWPFFPQQLRVAPGRS